MAAVVSAFPSTTPTPLRESVLQRSPASRRVRCGARCGPVSEEAGKVGEVLGGSLYGLLAVEQNVSLTDIKSAYRQMARRYHPDVCAPSRREECTRLFLQVQDAYEILSDPEQRAAYDYHLMHPLSANALGFGRMVRNKRRERENASDAWRLQWQAQLSRIGMRARTEQNQTEGESWGARMRRRSSQERQSGSCDAGKL